ncbi:iron-siderophore ABC transporter substrate-binding protein [Paenibacillus glycanilyticus]|uniref:ABC transporter substrate-binding protein n=1 Tax=Paenibacillus glycanilyticus TaxID=126569 RepID=UPI00203DECF5|nr:iron-siderophore ABC transporter substrate-binding protein [Paenibacillus glycanilyticus]MCM3628056.1 iron-siderophore ABC transporter substrate-binding protein [Paenibacillus glycanilyticus]
MKQMKWTGLILAAMMVFLAACGGGNNSNNAGNNKEASEQASTNANASTNTASEDTAERTIKHALGETKISGTPKKVVVLEWTYAEDLIALGVQPAGVADVKGYGEWYGAINPKLDAAVVDVGTRQEPSIETITSLAPDLIIGVGFRHEAIYDQLSAIAPTLIFNPYPEEGGPDQYSEMEQTFSAIADALGKKAEGEKVLADLHTFYDDSKAKLASAGKEGQEIVFTQAWTNEGVATFRLFTDNSMAMAILAKVGLKNAHQDSAFQQYGYSETDIEGLTKTPNASVLYTTSATDTVFSELLPNNEVYKNLNFAKENRVYDMQGIWPFGGPLSAKLLVERTLEVLG